MAFRWMRAAVTAGLGLSACAAPPSEPEPSSTTDAGTAVPDTRLLVLPPIAPCDPIAPVPAALRVATWNIGATLGSSIEEIQAVLEQVDADIVAVQEIEIGAERSGAVDQPAVLAAALGYDYAFAAALRFDGGDFGLAVFSRLPFQDARRITLESDAAYEPRIALDTTVCAGSTPLRMVDVHADFVDDANLDNLGSLAAQLGLVNVRTVIAGDFNAQPDTEGVQLLIETTGTVDVFVERDPGPTREGERIDFMLASPPLDASVQDTGRLSGEASDHALLWVDLHP